MHQADYEARQKKDWTLLKPYIAWPGLKFDDYEEETDILNPLLEAQLADPDDQELACLIHDLYNHPNNGLRKR